MPALPTAGVPLRTPVVGLKVMPFGNTSVWLSLRTGCVAALACTVNVPAKPSVKMALAALVNFGAGTGLSVAGWKLSV